MSERYRRQMQLPGFGPDQQKRLGAARITVIGAGGLGSPVLTYLAAAGAGSLADGGTVTVVDPDVVDLSNLHRQVIHDQSSLGVPKATSATRRMRAINPEIDARPRQEVLSVENALEVLSGTDIVIDGTDNFPTRYLISDACEILDIPVVWGSILAHVGQVSVFHGEGGRGVTYRDVHPVPPLPGTVPSCSEAGVLGMLCGVIGSVMALQSLHEVTGLGTTLRGRVALFDALTTRWREVAVARNPDRPPVEALEDLTLTCGLPGPPIPSVGTGTDGIALVPPDAVLAEDLQELLADGVRLIDIREDAEVTEGWAAGAEHVPSAQLLQEPERYGDLEGAVLYCAAGKRSAAARRALAERGITVRSLHGGFAALLAAGVPTRRH